MTRFIPARGAGRSGQEANILRIPDAAPEFYVSSAGRRKEIRPQSSRRREWDENDAFAPYSGHSRSSSGPYTSGCMLGRSGVEAL